MSDYLDHLAIITAGAGKDLFVLPRLPSMYESLPPDPDLAGQASPSAKAEGEPEGAEPNTSSTTSFPLMRFPNFAARAAGMPAPQEQTFPAPVEADPRAEPEAEAKTKAVVQHPDGMPSETDGAAKNEGLQRDSILPPPGRVNRAAVLPGEADPTEHESPFLPPFTASRARRRDPIQGERRSPERIPITGSNEPQSGSTPDSRQRNVSLPNEVKPRESGDLNRVDRDPGSQNAGPARWKLSSQTAPTETGFEVGRAAPGEKEGEPLPAFSSPAMHRQRSADAASTGTAARAKQPLVRVSIGRVEVRAIMPAAPAEKAAPPKPRISLDEYLRQQAEGRR